MRAERGSLSAAQARDFLAAAESPLRVLLLTLLVCGLRISEACGLRWRDVDFEARLVRKRFAWKFGAYQEMKSKASRKDIPLPDELLAVLAQLKARTRWDGPDHPVFASRTGRPLDQKNLLNRKLKPSPAGSASRWFLGIGSATRQHPACKRGSPAAGPPCLAGATLMTKQI